MRYAKNQCWLNPNRLTAELQEDGSVVFAEDITESELKEVVKNLFCELEIRRQQTLEKWKEGYFNVERCT